MYLREAFTLLVDYSHNMDHRQMICIKFQIHKLYWCMNLHRKFKEIVTWNFFKITFIMCPKEILYLYIHLFVIFVILLCSYMLYLYLWNEQALQRIEETQKLLHWLIILITWNNELYCIAVFHYCMRVLMIFYVLVMYIHTHVYKK